MAASKPLSASPTAAQSAEPQVAANGAKSNGAGESLLTVNNLVMHFPLTRGIIFQKQSWRGSGRRRHLVQCQAGRDARSGRRVGLRQVDHRPGDSSALQAHRR